ncbi:hypothetical protein ACOWK9_00685 [Helicobacter pylori]|uniref:Uncharacterized protein n=1 Tax=Helicobacter pylori TaxID=210 RepID=A0AAE7AS73_HELPX|nr:hypothetical protein [Helicobacter pylori]QJW28774.1 hypothetical protein C528_000510 [Helicobacter pylori A45]QJW41528.1 hypothetical protein HK441_00510 [Helicobacter pylori]QJW42983.1 hypothetical protein HK440_00510 [Helicobacter pylori]WQT38403.1 hypothetical protein KVE36_03345 [Helicobacter pylori]
MTQDFLELTEGIYLMSEEQMLDFMEMGVEPKSEQETKIELEHSLENEVNKNKEH